MIDERPEHEEDPSEMSDAIIDAVNKERVEDDDAFSKPERKVERTKEEERILKAKELKKQLRMRELGILRYRWPTAVLLISGIFSILTEFLDIWVQIPNPDPAYGFDSYWAAFIFNPNVFWLFPIISGSILIVISYFAYTRPKYTFISIIPAMMMAIAGAFPFLLIEIAFGVVEIEMTLVPIQMVIVAILSLLAIAMREKE
ncbi:MAG: hypothetical protein ACW98Y_20115 [Candidatus Thorarchaeota archaeon]|jgi:hypothetical protein